MGRGDEREAGRLLTHDRWRRSGATGRWQGAGAVARWPLGAGAPGGAAPTARAASHGRGCDPAAPGRRAHRLLLGAMVSGRTPAPRRGLARRWRARTVLLYLV